MAGVTNQATVAGTMFVCETQQQIATLPNVSPQMRGPGWTATILSQSPAPPIPYLSVSTKHFASIVLE